MFKLRGNPIVDVRHAFSLAEMMVVLMIISFLILALPPIVHKKVAKRITRGEHGRYECWKDPGTGKLMEYYATEKAGVKKGGTVANPTGEVVSQCSFKPKEMAPNAAYFAFQVIGGGAGGSYPIYDASDKSFKDPAHRDTANVKLLSGVRGDACCKEYKNDVNGACKSWESAPIYDYEFATGKDPGYGTLTKYCSHYAASISYYSDKMETKDWIKKYWVPVENDKPLEICSGSGFTGTPDFTLAGTTPNTSFYYGGRGGAGKCLSVNEGTLKLDKENRFTITYSTRSNDTYHTSESNGRHANNKFFRSWIEHKALSWEFPETGVNDSLMDFPGHWANPEASWLISNSVECALDNDVTTVLPAKDNCNSNYYGNYIVAQFEGGGTPSDAPLCKIGPGANGASGRQDNGNFTTQSPVWSFQNADNAILSDGTVIRVNGDDAVADCTPEWVAIGLHKYNAPGKAFGGGDKTVYRPNSYWGEIKSDMKDTTINTYYKFFPTQIDVSYQFGYDTPTFGYAGMPGEGVSTFLSDLPNELVFEIGDGGNAGTSSSQSGKSGKDTIVKSKNGDVTTVLLTAKGGLARPGGEAAAKIRMFGKDTCPQTNTEGGKPDGCLDKGVALYDEAKMRFADDSGFYTILELDSDSKTPSAIYSLYGKLPTSTNPTYTPMPGTAGDGGYSFIRNADGVEKLLYSGYRPAQMTALTNLTVHDEETGLDVTLAPFKLSDGLTRTHDSYIYSGEYKCYKRYDTLGSANGSALSGENATVCLPGQGYPGAVVIVW